VQEEEKLAASAEKEGEPELSEEEKQRNAEEKAAKAMGKNSGAFMVGNLIACCCC
jgi:hypothetical protein